MLFLQIVLQSSYTFHGSTVCRKKRFTFHHFKIIQKSITLLPLIVFDIFSSSEELYTHSASLEPQATFLTHCVWTNCSWYLKTLLYFVTTSGSGANFRTNHLTSTLAVNFFENGQLLPDYWNSNLHFFIFFPLALQKQFLTFIVFA